MKKFHIYNLELEDVFKKKMKNNKKKLWMKIDCGPPHKTPVQHVLLSAKVAALADWCYWPSLNQFFVGGFSFLKTSARS